jgi:hypothetical protein
VRSGKITKVLILQQPKGRGDQRPGSANLDRRNGERTGRRN